MKSSEISAFLQEHIDVTAFPSAVYLVAEKGEIVFQDTLGFAVVVVLLSTFAVLAASVMPDAEAVEPPAGG